MRFCGGLKEPCHCTDGGKPARGAHGGEEGGDEKGRACPALPQPSPLSGHPTRSHLHAIGLVAHGHRLVPHVTHGAGLRRLGDGWEALRGLGGHVLSGEGCDGSGLGTQCASQGRGAALPAYLIALARSGLVG